MCILHSRDTHAGAMLATMGDPAHATANATFHVQLHLALPFVPVFVCVCGEGGGLHPNACNKPHSDSKKSPPIMG